MKITTYIRSYHHELPADHECNDADIQNLVEEIENIRQDDTLKRYENPMASDIQDILARAAAYHGPWYHTDVVFDMDIEVTDTYRTLRQRLLDLPASSGVNVTTRYNIPELEAILGSAMVDFAPSSASQM